MDQEHIDLVVHAKAGDRNSFAQLYNLYYKKVYASIRTLIDNKKDAEDITQDTFLRAWRNISSISNPSAFNAWIQKIANNLCYRYLHKQSIRILRDATLDPQEDEMSHFQADLSEELIPSVYVERDDLRSRLHEIINKLLPAQKQTLTLYYFDGLKTEEIAQVMDCSVNTVKTRLRLARKTIQLEILEWEEKTNERFIGVWGIPMLPIGEAILPFFQSNTLSQAAANNILSNILNSAQQITQNAAPTLQGVGSAAHGAGKAAVPVAKLFLGGLAVASLGLGTYLAIGSILHSPSTAPMEATAIPPAQTVSQATQAPTAAPLPVTSLTTGTAASQPAEETIVWTDSAFEMAVRTYLGIAEAPIGVKSAQALKELSLTFSSGTVSLGDLVHFPNLENLLLNGSGQTLNLSPLTQLDALSGLHIIGAQVPDLSPLSTLPTLGWLSLTNVHLSDTSSLSTLKDVNFLCLSNTSAFDLSLLTGLKNLERLQISDMNLSDITPLGNLTSLRWLCLMNTQVSDISPLVGLSALNWLDVSYTQVVDLSPIVNQSNPPHLVTDGLLLVTEPPPESVQ